jgi:hypothetical protein
MAPQETDIRLAERAQRKTGGAAASPDAAKLPDVAQNVVTPSAEELEKLRADLIAEQELRTRRIERFIKEGPIKPVPRAIIPVSENDL